LLLLGTVTVLVSFALISYAALSMFTADELDVLSEELSTFYSQSLLFIPTGLNFSEGPSNRPTHEAWLELLSGSSRSIHIAALYWNLNSTEYPTAAVGRDVFSRLVDAGKRGVDIRIAQDVSKGMSDNNDSKWLADSGLAQVGLISSNVVTVHGNVRGISGSHFEFHEASGLWIGKYGLEVKELGLYIQDCPCLAADLLRIFAVYWHLGQEAAVIPQKWPSIFETAFNMSAPMQLTWSGVETDVFLSSSPAAFNPNGREHDLQTIVSLISSARRSVCVAVMDLIPQTLYMECSNGSPSFDGHKERRFVRSGLSRRSPTSALVAFMWFRLHPTESSPFSSLVQTVPEERITFTAHLIYDELAQSAASLV
uniref:PLDc_3 domain-containing protein n=1 Tax=Heligmosomoides polygyrus TaxID=6339 RepID=A0A183FKD6_HELPZ